MADESSERNRRIRVLEKYLLIGWAGRQFDSIPEMSMHVGIWMAMFGLGGIYYSHPLNPMREAIGFIILGLIVGVAGQLAVEVPDGVE